MNSPFSVGDNVFWTFQSWIRIVFCFCPTGNLEHRGHLFMVSPPLPQPDGVACLPGTALAAPRPAPGQAALGLACCCSCCASPAASQRARRPCLPHAVLQSSGAVAHARPRAYSSPASTPVLVRHSACSLQLGVCFSTWELRWNNSWKIRLELRFQPAVEVPPVATVQRGTSSTADFGQRLGR